MTDIKELVQFSRMIINYRITAICSLPIVVEKA